MLTRRNIIITAVLSVCMLRAAAPMQATTYYVTKAGNDSNACSQSQPCLTITRGGNVATQPGDIVQVEAGTYNEKITLTHSGSAGGGKITFRGQDGSGCPTTVDADVNSRGARPAPTVTMLGFSVQASYVVIDCFTITGNGSPGVDITASRSNIDVTNNYMDGQGTGAPWVGVNFPVVTAPTRPSNVYVAKNYITRTIYGFLIFCTSCTFEDNEVERMINSSSTATGNDDDYSRIFGDSITMRHNYMHGNTIADCKGAGCHIDCFQTWNIGNPYETATNIIIDRNTCFNAHEAIIIGETTSTTVGSYASHYNWTVTNNVFAHGPVGSGMVWAGIYVHTGNVVIENNTFGEGVVGCLGGTTCTAVKNNIFYRMGWQPYGSSISGQTNGVIVAADHNLIYESGRTYSGFSGDILNRDPLFVNAGADNWRLQSTSPAKDAASNVGILVDHDGGARPQGAGYDIGSYEFGSITTQQPQPPTGLRATVQ
jgi:hypothetical protein